MKLRDILIKRTILLPMHTTTKEVANQELLTHLQSMDILSATINLYTNIKEQENIFASSVRGIAYPYTTSIEIDKLTCVQGISKRGINYNSPDGHDSHLILLVLSSSDYPTEHHKCISQWEEDDNQRDGLVQ